MPATTCAGPREPIAVVGVGLRFPGGNDTLEGFERFLRRGGSGIVPLPADRFAPDWQAPAGSPPPERPDGLIRTAGGGFLTGIDAFDAGFFNVSPREADYLDPQHRLLLETAWTALENANIDPGPLRHGDGGVYVGASSIDYALELESVPYTQLDPALATGFTIYPMSGRLSYFLGWRGPSLSVDTACSSSLTALHLAVSGLRHGECGIALVGAVNLIHHPRTLVLFSHGRMLAPDGRSKSFDEAADGYARAEGCGVLVLKRYADAVRDGNEVLALVRGTALGQDGESAGLTVPNGTAQERTARAALADAGLTPADVQYVEAHGTGTPLGDPVEAGSINAVFGAAHSAEDPLYVGSLKSNLGHMEPAAGLGGVVKTILQLRARELFPHLYDKPSARIPWRDYPFAVPVECTPWRAPRRRAVINSFGFAGAIGVAVLEEAPEPAPVRVATEDGRSTGHVFTVSAKSPAAFEALVRRYRDLLAERPETDIADLCYTGNVGRAHFPLRAAAVVRDRDELAEYLARAAAPVRPSRTRKSVFLFSGTGTQYSGMGAQLYRRFPVYREQLDECDRLLRQAGLDLSVRELMLDGTAADELHRIRYAQPALFALEYALARLWLGWGVRPSALIGHSLGEITAATVAGVFDLEDAARFVTARAELMDGSCPGAMAAVELPADEAGALVAQHPPLALAAVNSARQCVISGPEDALGRAMAALAGRGVRATRLRTARAVHSPMMREIAEPLREVLTGLRFHEPTLTVVSNVTGRIADPAALATPDYWIEHLCGTVRFESGIRTVAARGRHVFIEIGPADTLLSIALDTAERQDHVWLACMHPSDTEGLAILRAAAKAHTAGLPLSWAAFHAGAGHRAVQLPTYAFDRKSYWLPKPRLHTRLPEAAGSSNLRMHGVTLLLDEAVEERNPHPEYAPGENHAPGEAARAGTMLDAVLAAVAHVLRIDDPSSIDTGASFVELGLNSLVAAEFQVVLGRAVNREIPSTAVFDYPTPAALGAYLDDSSLAGRES